MATLRGWIASAALCVLAGCGGGSGKAPDISVSGTAATGAPMAGAAISLLCNGGQEHKAVAGANGKYLMMLPFDCAAPYMLKAELDGKTLYAYSDDAGNINITPFTDVAAYIASKGLTAEDYAAITAGFKQVSDMWSAVKQLQIAQDMVAKLASVGLNTPAGMDIFHSLFDAKIGDVLDDLLEAFQQVLGPVPASSFAAQFVNAGGTALDKPWQTLFKPGVSSRTVVGGNCAYDPGNGNIVATGDATVTLTSSGSQLLVSIAATGAPQAPAIEVGGEGTYFGLFYPGGSEPGRKVGVTAGSGPVSLIVFDPAVAGPLSLPAVGFSVSGGASLYCSTLVEGIATGSLHEFDIPSRVSAVIGTATNIVSPPEGCDIPNTNPVQTYTYAVSPVGALTINGQTYTSFDLGSASTAAGYMDGFEWETGSVRKSVASVGVLILPLVTLERSSEGFSHKCDLQML
jgi:hypothetical protein